MKKEELKKLKDKLMQPGWTEDLHHELIKLPKEDAKQIVDSMTESQIYCKVNNREYQEDYIADYLRYLWGISEDAFWKHTQSTIDIKHGILWADHMFHFEKMCKHKIPNDLLKTIMDFIVKYDENAGQDNEAVGCVIKAQVNEFGRLEEIKKYISNLDKSIQSIVEKRINEMIKCECSYYFY